MAEDSRNLFGHACFDIGITRDIAMHGTGVQGRDDEPRIPLNYEVLNRTRCIPKLRKVKSGARNVRCVSFGGGLADVRLLNV